MFDVVQLARALVTTAFVITAVASAPGRALASPEKSCAGVAEARNAAVAALHDTWQDHRDKLATLRELADSELSALNGKSKRARHEIREILRHAKKDFDEIRRDTRGEIRDLAEDAFDVCGGDDEDEDVADDQTPAQTVDLTRLASDLAAIVDQASKDMDTVLDQAAVDVKSVIDEAKAQKQKDEQKKKDDEHKKDDKKKDGHKDKRDKKDEKKHEDEHGDEDEG